MIGGGGNDGRLGGGGDEAFLARRVVVLGLLIGLVFSVFALRLFELQVIEGADLKNRSDRNRVRTVRLERRDRGTICVVEKPSGAMAIEKGGTYRGLYHVLHGTLNPLEGIGPDELRIDKLMRRLDQGEVLELIVATNATAEGEVDQIHGWRI